MSTGNQIISNAGSIANIFIFIIAVVSAIIAFITYTDSKKRKKREKAIELTNFYVNSILKPSAFISDALLDSEFEKISRECFKRNDIKDFDLTEINRLISVFDSQLTFKSLNDLANSIPPEKIHNAIIFRDEFIDYSSRNQLYVRYFKLDDEESAKEFISITSRNQLRQSITDLLNNIEWFAMNFISGVADDETVYQSLHQTYLAIVTQLYFFIARVNNSAYNKYYTNAITLFDEWKAREKLVKNKEERFESKATRKKKQLTKRQKRI